MDAADPNGDSPYQRTHVDVWALTHRLRETGLPVGRQESAVFERGGAGRTSRNLEHPVHPAGPTGPARQTGTRTSCQCIGRGHALDRRTLIRKSMTSRTSFLLHPSALARRRRRMTERVRRHSTNYQPRRAAVYSQYSVPCGKRGQGQAVGASGEGMPSIGELSFASL